MRNNISTFFHTRKDQSKCLLDLPVFSHSVDYEKMDSKPGMLYEVNKQCEMKFGTGSKLCNKKVNLYERAWKFPPGKNPGNSEKWYPRRKHHQENKVAWVKIYPKKIHLEMLAFFYVDFLLDLIIRKSLFLAENNFLISSLQY